MVNRRSLLKYAGISVAAIAVGAGGYVLPFGRRGLAGNLSPLFDPLFSEAAADVDPGIILKRLIAKGVIDENDEIDTSAVNELARTDQSTEYKGRFFTQTELELYSLAYLSRETDLSLLDEQER